MATKITFGKYSGYTTESLKQVDPDYLRWGAKNLRSDYWRNEFAKAAASVTNEDEALAMARTDGIDFDEALRHIKEAEAEQAAEERRFEAARQAERRVFEKWAAVLGQKASYLEGTYRKYEFDWQELPASMFSSREKHEAFRQMCAEADAAGEAAYSESAKA